MSTAIWSRRNFLRVSALCTVAAAVPVAAAKAATVWAADATYDIFVSTGWTWDKVYRKDTTEDTT